MQWGDFYKYLNYFLIYTPPIASKSMGDTTKKPFFFPVVRIIHFEGFYMIWQEKDKQLQLYINLQNVWVRQRCAKILWELESFWRMSREEYKAFQNNNMAFETDICTKCRLAFWVFYAADCSSPHLSLNPSLADHWRLHIKILGQIAAGFKGKFLWQSLSKWQTSHPCP